MIKIFPNEISKNFYGYKNQVSDKIFFFLTPNAQVSFLPHIHKGYDDRAAKDNTVKKIALPLYKRVFINPSEFFKFDPISNMDPK